MADLLTRIAARASGKDLSDLHPELGERIHLMRVFSDEVPQESVLSFASAAADYQRHTWVHKAVKVLADNISSLPVRVVHGVGNDLEELDQHPVSFLLAYPNAILSPAMLWRQWVIDMMLAGEEGQEIVKGANGGLSEIWPRQPSAFAILPGSRGLRYYDVAGYKIDDSQGAPYNLDPDEFIHYKFYNPANQWRGLSPITAIRMSISIDQLAQAWSRLFFKNSARPDYAIIGPAGITQSEKEDIYRKLTAEHSGDKAHEPLVLEQGIVDVKPLTFPPKDMEWVNQRELSREEIGAVFGVPDEIMGWGKDTYENFSQAQKVLVTLTIAPIVGLRDDSLTTFFRRGKYLKPDERVETDMRLLLEGLEDKNQSWVMAQGQITAGALTINEYRQSRGMPEVAWGDSWWMPFSNVPVSDSQPEPPAPAGQRSYKAAVPEYGTAAHEVVWKRQQSRVTVPAKKMRAMLKRSFQRQQVDVGKRLRNSREFGRGRFKQNAPPVGELFDVDEWTPAFEEEYGEIVGDTMQAVGNAELGALGLGQGFDMTRPRTRMIFERILHSFAQKTNDTTYDELVSLFADAEVAGEGIPAIMERLSAYWDGRKSDWQTERIARTVMNGAANGASHEAWEQSEVVGGQSWISALIPDRTRDAHADAHAQTVGLDEPFIVDGEELAYPGDPDGSPGNIINCLCTAVAVLSDEMGYRPPMRRQPDTKKVEDDMQIHTHVHLPESMKVEMPTPQLLVQTPERLPIQVDVHVAGPEMPKIEITNEIPAAAAPVIQNEIVVQMPEEREQVEEIKIEQRDAAGRPSKMTRTRKTVGDAIGKPYPNEHACRVRDPKDFEADSFRRVSRKTDGKTYYVIMGRLKGETTMTEQAYRYPKDDWTVAEARKHCKSHDGISFEPAREE